MLQTELSNPSEHLSALEKAERLNVFIGQSLATLDDEGLKVAAQSLGMTKKDVKKVTSWLYEHFPETYEKISGKPQENLRLLLDENLPHYLAPQLHKYGYVSSVYLQGWVGKKDWYLHRYAEMHGHFNAIVSQDRARKSSRDTIETRDLTNVALDRFSAYLRSIPSPNGYLYGVDKLPMIIHLPTKRPYRDGTVETFSREFNKISALIKSHEYAVIQVTPAGVECRDEMRLKNIWDLVNNPEVSENPVEHNKYFARVLRSSAKIAGQKQHSIRDMMSRVKRDAKNSYIALIKKNPNPSWEEVLDLIANVHQKIARENKEDTGVMILEMAIKSVKRLMLEEQALEANKATLLKPAQS
ncbi:MAG: hypothetical protein KDJ35_07145 [Alphaproteobacteria bacterium]|nr:hypothetical protein [Alphaproteobacteria bacterium]